MHTYIHYVHYQCYTILYTSYGSASAGARTCMLGTCIHRLAIFFICVPPLCVGIQRTAAGITENVCFCSRSVLLSGGGHVVGSYLLGQQTGDNEMGADRPQCKRCCRLHCGKGAKWPQTGIKSDDLPLSEHLQCFR